MESLQRYATLAPGDANPFDSMGELLFTMGRLDEAIEQYERYLSFAAYAARGVPEIVDARRRLDALKRP